MTNPKLVKVTSNLLDSDVKPATQKAEKATIKVLKIA